MREPTLRQGAAVAIAGYLLSFGVPYASFSILPHVLVGDDAAQTATNVAAHPGALAFAMLAMLANFVGDVLAAWGLYVLLRPTSESVSMLAAWIRVAYAAAGIVATLNLATALQLSQHGAAATAVHASLVAFSAQFGASLIVFGAYLVLLGWLFLRSTHVPRWLGVVLVLDGLGWIVMQAAPYVAPGANVGFLFVTTLGELVLLVWLIGWGLRLPEPAPR